MSSKQAVNELNAGLVTISVIGLALSYYAYAVETAKEENADYEAMCDINEHISCTKVFSSEYGKGFGLIPETSGLYAPNSLYGLIFYTVVAILSLFNKYIASVFVVTAGIISTAGSIYLAYILYVLSNICVICVSTYVVNIAILILAVKKHRKLFQNGTNKKKKKRKSK